MHTEAKVFLSQLESRKHAKLYHTSCILLCHLQSKAKRVFGQRISPLLSIKRGLNGSANRAGGSTE